MADLERMSEVSFEDYTGKRCEVNLDISDYMVAGDKKMSLSQYYANKYPTRDDQPSALEQFACSVGIRTKGDIKRGIRPSTVKEILHSTIMDKGAGPIVRGTGSDRFTPAGRILFPEIMLQLINEVLYVNKDDYLIPWENAFAMRTSVTGPRVDQPLVNVSGLIGGASPAMPIAQLAEPAVMINITLNARTYTIPTKSIGLLVSDQAIETATIDFVALMLAAQARGERILRIEADMANIINGDVDTGVPAVTFNNASTFDPNWSSYPAGTQLSHRAWFKWRRNRYQYMHMTHVLLNADNALDLDLRVGRPTIFGDNSTEGQRLNANLTYSEANVGVSTPQALILPASITGANKIVGFDSRYALHEVTNVSASYSAIEEFVMRRAAGMRFDYGIAVFKLYSDAFDGLTLGA